MRDFEVAYTFGVEPLQQYLVRFPDGRVQVLPFGWNVVEREWFHLYADEPVPAGDLLHWTGIQQNWNHMCAACHSTHVDKGYRPETDRFETTFGEIDVSCEACHGPGSEHVRLEGKGGLAVGFPARGSWRFAPDAAVAHRQPALPDRTQVETCGRCHARASLLSQDAPAGQPLLDTHRVALLDRGLYFADGQIDAEVYVYGSFLQSRMYAVGVQCSDCHDPHSLRIEGVPDDTCARCHRPEAFATPAHHRHEPGSPGASCVACHMPERTYMQIDARRDHGFRVPRRLSGEPDACASCHADGLVDWRPEPRAHFGPVLRAGRARAPGSAEALVALAGDRAQPAIARATALRLLGEQLSPGAIPALTRGVDDGDPLVRMAALGSAAGLPPGERLLLARPKLADPVRAVRLEAETALRGVPEAELLPLDRAAIAYVRGEYRALQLLHADRPESWINLGLLELASGNAEAALASYRRALEIEPRFVPAAVNLADLYRALDRDADGEQLLLSTVARLPESADAWHALGLVRVRLGRRAEAAEALARAARLAPEVPRYAFVHAVSLHSAGDADAARRVLRDLVERHPDYAPALEFQARIGE
jgi:tetratricopeptide (TPR) repeat protein